MASPPTDKHPTGVVSHTNRRGVTYFLHERKTKTGKSRFVFARTVDDGVVGALPAGFEVSESVNGVVSLRRTIAGVAIAPAADLKLVGDLVVSHPHLRRHLVRAEGASIVVFEPQPGARYTPVLRFDLDGGDTSAGAPRYAVRRMTYRGDGGWSWVLDAGALDDLATKFVRHVGTEKFFDLM